MIIALSGGVGGAKLAAGLAQTLAPDELLTVANTGDDFRHLGLHIAPDLDSVMYALAGIENRDAGWGVADEGWRFMESLRRLGGETWFQLGDRDLATHVMRSELLAAGHSLAEATAALCASLGIRHRLTPMSDDAVRTVVLSDAGELPFQRYFVQRRCEPVVRGFRFDGAEAARPATAFADALRRADLAAVVLCPSNPYLSIDPILSLRGVRAALRRRTAPTVAVSPLVGGRALKGPAAKIMRELGVAADVLGIAEHYRGLIDGLVIDAADSAQRSRLPAEVAVHVTDTVMRAPAQRQALAEEVLRFAGRLAR